MSKKPKKYSKYDDNFKNRAVEMVLRGERSLSQAALNLGVGVSTLHKWKGDYLKRLSATEEGLPAGEPKLEDVLREMRELRKELHYVEEEREILKKTVSIFSSLKRSAIK